MNPLSIYKTTIIEKCGPDETKKSLQKMLQNRRLENTLFQLLSLVSMIGPPSQLVCSLCIKLCSIFPHQTGLNIFKLSLPFCLILGMGVAHP
jgi:hypothetical protein